MCTQHVLRPLVLGPSFAAFPHALAESWIGNGAAWARTGAPIWDAVAAGNGLMVKGWGVSEKTQQSSKLEVEKWTNYCYREL